MLVTNGSESINGLYMYSLKAAMQVREEGNVSARGLI